MESLPARTLCLGDGKRMSADLSELEPKAAFAPAGMNTEGERDPHVLLWIQVVVVASCAPP